jgi:glycosyltransferase involved in cell wall biosynthesis
MNRTVRVDVLVISSAHPLGDARIAVKEAPTLAQRYRVALIMPRAADMSPADERTLAAGVTHVDAVAPQRGAGLVSRVLRIARAVRRSMRYRPSVIHLHDPELLLFLPLWRALGARHIVFDVHEDPRTLLSDRSYPGSSLLGMGARVTVRRLIGGCHTVIAERSYKKHLRDALSVTEVLNYPIVDMIGYDPPGERRQALRLVYLGVLAPDRALVEIITAVEQAVREGVDVTLDLIGSARGQTVGWLGRTVSERSAWLRCPGPLPPRQAWAELASYDVGLAVLHDLANYRESFPTKIPEYLLAGLKVVCSDFPLYRSLLDPRDALFVDPASTEDIVMAIKRCAAERDDELSRRERRRRAKRDFSWDTEAAKLMALYADLIPTPGRGRDVA